MFDAIIVGGGPAGLSAALTLGRALRPALLIDSGEYRNSRAADMHNVLTRDGMAPQEFRAIAHSQLEAYATVQTRSVAVDHGKHLPGGEGFELSLGDGTTVQTRRLVIATGLADDLPPIEGMQELWGRGVYHCPYCHGYETRDTTIAVLSGDPMMIELALHLRRFSSDVVLCTNGDDIDSTAMSRLSHQEIAVRGERVVRLEPGTKGLERVVFESGASLNRQSMFAMSQYRQRSDLAAQLGCDLLPDGCVAVDDFQVTSVPGVYAAGDMAHRTSLPMPTPFVVTATASGTIAAISADKNLVATDTAFRPA
ncbi:NAD(P)/FAD-dependent oxidoreductase [Aeromicrobium sp. CF3.5]|uniref:NAD(P)/FAD-dependent oxidoreductase n=1 Tax=Aeromicrobium sp. CF3.5 TaxID=3373078 RepID=UPI003EE6BBA7